MHVISLIADNKLGMHDLWNLSQVHWFTFLPESKVFSLLINQSIPSSQCLSLFSKHFIWMKWYSLVSSNMKRPFCITYELYWMFSFASLLMMHSDELKSFAMALIDFIYYFLSYKVKCSDGIRNLSIFVLHLATAIDPHQPLPIALEFL